MKLCPHCGQSLAEGAKNCGACGKSLGKNAEAVQIYRKFWIGCVGLILLVPLVLLHWAKITFPYSDLTGADDISISFNLLSFWKWPDVIAEHLTAFAVQQPSLSAVQTAAAVLLGALGVSFLLLLLSLILRLALRKKNYAAALAYSGLGLNALAAAAFMIAAVMANSAINDLTEGYIPMAIRLMAFPYLLMLVDAVAAGALLFIAAQPVDNRLAQHRESPIVLSLRGIGKSFGGQVILNDISLDITRGEFITLLGPSGCGKTTTLRIVAGLETADTGCVLLNGADVTLLEPDMRNVNTVFQNYALFPHMNVFDNVAYGPRIRRTDKELVPAMVAEMLALVQMEGYEKRMPNQLSGGQRQRIAIARALINRPDIVLLDEPLGALDLKLRQHMQTELKQIQKKTGVTFIYVTHDQEEALNMSDRLVVMNNGRFEQVGTPSAVYNRPQTRFVAEFVGSRNLLDVTVAGKNRALFSSHSILTEDCVLPEGSKALIAIHADKVRIAKKSTTLFSLPGIVIDTAYIGSQIKVHVAVGSFVFTIIDFNAWLNPAIGETVYLYWDPEHGVIIPV